MTGVNGQGRIEIGRATRRGFLVGITLAELMLIILFVLLLLNRNVRLEVREAEKAFLKIEEIFFEVEEDFGGEAPLSEARRMAEKLVEVQPRTELSETWRTLTRSVKEQSSRPEQLERWLEDLASNPVPDLSQTKKSAEAMRDEIRGLRSRLVDAETARERAENHGRQLEEKLQNRPAEVEDALAVERQEREQAEQRVSQLSDELRVLKKGQNPPCWYELVPDGEDGEREKSLYAFDIGVFDKHMVIRRREPPPGGAFDDDGTTYAEEWNDLLMSEIAYDVPLSNQELLAQLQRIHDSGKQREVRSYSCVFSVRVWDETSSGAKQRWQQAHDRTLEWLFGTFRVQDEPWESSE